MSSISIFGETPLTKYVNITVCGGGGGAPTQNYKLYIITQITKTVIIENELGDKGWITKYEYNTLI